MRGIKTKKIKNNVAGIFFSLSSSWDLVQSISRDLMPSNTDPDILKFSICLSKTKFLDYVVEKEQERNKRGGKWGVES